MELNHKEALNQLRAGKLEEVAITAIKQVAKEVSAKYKK
jgi:hypothetical protein